MVCTSTGALSRPFDWRSGRPSFAAFPAPGLPRQLGQSRGVDGYPSSLIFRCRGSKRAAAPGHFGQHNGRVSCRRAGVTGSGHRSAIRLGESTVKGGATSLWHTSARSIGSTGSLTPRAGPLVLAQPAFRLRRRRYDLSQYQKGAKGRSVSKGATVSKSL